MSTTPCSPCSRPHRRPVTPTSSRSTALCCTGLIEQIFGIRSNVYEKKLTVDVNLTEAYGIDRYPFGLDGLVAIKVKARSSATQEPQVEITSDVPLELTVLWGDKQKTASVKPGTQTI